MVPCWRCRCDKQKEALRLKRGGGLHPARPDWLPPKKRPRATPEGLIAVSVTACHAGRVCPRGCARPLLWAEP